MTNQTQYQYASRFTKEDLANITKECYYNIKMDSFDPDYYEGLDHHHGAADIDAAWKEYDRFDGVCNVTPEMMWEDESFRFNSHQEHQDHLEECEQLILLEKQLELHYEHHHLTFEQPYWMMCVDKINGAING